MEARDSRRTVRVFGVGLVVVLAAGAVAAPGPAGGRGGYGPGRRWLRRAHAGPTASATATAPATVAPPARTRPRRRSTRGRPAGRRPARSLRKGLVLSVRCSEDCRHVTQVFVNRKQARKLGVNKKAKRRVLVGKKTSLLKANVARTIRVKFSTKAKRGIRRIKRRKVRKLQLTIRTSTRDASNNVRRYTTTLSFKR